MGELDITVGTVLDDSSAVVVNVSGPLTIQYVAELKDVLLKAMATAQQLSLDLTGVTEVDLAGLQLLCSAHLSCLHSGKRFAFASDGNEIIKAASMEAGFQRHVRCAQDRDKTCLWLGGKQ